MKKILFVFFILFVFNFTFSKAFYNPGKPTGYVNDFAGILANAEKIELEKIISNYEKISTNEISVAIIKSLQGDSIENFANLLFSQWGIGKKGKDNGLLFLIAVEDRKMRIETGYGLEPYLTDSQAFWIQESLVKPFFKEQRYADGIKAGVEKIIAGLSGTETIPAMTETSQENVDLSGWVGGSFVFIWFLFGILAPFLSWVVAIFGRSKSWWLGGLVGGIVGAIIWLFGGLFFLFPILAIIGLIFDYTVSKNYKAPGRTSWWAGGNHTFWDSWSSGRSSGSSKGSNFSGFGRGSSGGGGASSSW